MASNHNVAARLLAVPPPKKGGRRLPYQNILDKTPEIALKSSFSAAASTSRPLPQPLVAGSSRRPRVAGQSVKKISQVGGCKSTVKRARNARTKDVQPTLAPTTDGNEVSSKPLDDFTRLREIMGGSIIQETHPRHDTLTKPPNTKEIQEKRKAAALLANRVLLPSAYEALNSMFCAMEMMLRAKRCRGREFVGFDELRACVESSCHQRFDRRELGQIVFVDPTAYDIGVFQPKSDFDSQSRTQLKIAVKSSGLLALEPFSNSELLRRRQRFRQKLEDITREHHRDFVAKLDTNALDSPACCPPPSLTSPTNSSSATSSASPSSTIPSLSLSWHPLFDVETLPDLKEAPLPSIDTLNNASAPLLFFAPPALNTATTHPSSVTPTTPAIPTSLVSQFETVLTTNCAPSSLPSSNNFHGLDAAFVAKIYAKDASRLTDAAQGGPQHRQKCDSQVLLLGLASAVRAFLVSARRAVIPLDELAREMVRTGGTVDKTQESVEALLRSLTETVPQWCSLEVVAKITVFRCNIRENFVPIHQQLKEVQAHAREVRSRLP